MNWGAFALVILGFLVHMTFDVTGRAAWAAWLFPVNESVWEHMKLAYTALLIWGMVEWWRFGKTLHNFFTAKILGYLLINGIILVVFYGYHGLLKRVIVPIDIASYIVGCWLAQRLSFKLYRQPQRVWLNRLGALAFLAVGLLQVWFAFHPPRLGIFRDGPSGTYGYHRWK